MYVSDSPANVVWEILGCWLLRYFVCEVVYKNLNSQNVFYN